MTTLPRPQIALYLLDQDRKTTVSLGIFHYSRNLVRSIAESPYPGFGVTLWVCGGNADDFVPPSLPPWMRVVYVSGHFGTGLRRLAADHLIASGLAVKQRPSVIHFPKGYLPVWLPKGIGRIVTLHDTIIDHYRKYYPNFFPKSKTAYFNWLTRNALRRADHVIAVSRFSAGALAELAGSQPPPITVIASAGVDSGEPAAVAGIRRGIFVIGSRLPHKATAETLRRLDHYASTRHFLEDVTVAGVDSSRSIPGYSEPRNLRIAWAGRLPFTELQRRIGQSRALVVLSEIEGFGIPLLEAYSMHTPVCFRRATSMAEVLEDLPGAWDGSSDASFVTALDACLAMSPVQIAQIRVALAERYDWSQSVAATLAVYREVLHARMG